MIQLAKSIKVGPTVVPAGTVLYNKFQSNVVYYRGTKILLDRIPADAIFVPGESQASEAYMPGKHKLCAGVEAKIGEQVEVVDYNYDAPGHEVVVVKGKLQAYGTFAKYEEAIKKAGKTVYDAIKSAVKSGRTIVWQVNDKWFTSEDGKYGIEDAGLQIVPADATANTDNIMFNGAVVARIVSPSLAKASYPDVGYLNSKEHPITVLNNNDEVIDLKCIKKFDDTADTTADDSTDDDSEIVMAQDILNELAPIFAATESLDSTLSDLGYDIAPGMYDETNKAWSSIALQMVKSIVNLMRESFAVVQVHMSPTTAFIYLFDENGDGTNPICVVALNNDEPTYYIDPKWLEDDQSNIKIPTVHNGEAVAIVKKIIDIVAPTMQCVSCTDKAEATSQNIDIV